MELLNLLTPEKLLTVGTVLPAALSTGANVFISLVDHPARMKCGSNIALTVFAPWVPRAAILSDTNVLLSLICSFTYWHYYGKSIYWLIATLIFLSSLLWTFIIMLPTYKRLLDPKLDKDSAEAKGLLVKWEKLATVRTLICFTSLTLFLILM